MTRLSGLMERHLLETVRNTIQRRSYPVWINGSVLKICRDCISLVQKSCQVYSLDMRCTRRESGKETSWSQTLRNWNRWTPEIYTKRPNAKEVLKLMSGEKFTSQSQMETVKLSEGDQVLRTSTLFRDSPDRGEEQDNLRGESDGTFNPTSRLIVV